MITSEQLGYMATQYADGLHTDYDAVQKAFINEVVYSDLDNSDYIEVIDKYNEYLSESGYEEYFENDDVYLNELVSEPSELMRMALHGDYRYHDEYCQINGYGNLDSFSDYQIVREALKDNEFLEYVFYNDYIYDFEVLENDAKKAYQEFLKEGF